MHERNPHHPALRDLAAARRFLIGTAVSSRPFPGEETYCKVLSTEFNILTPENCMKMGPLCPERGHYDFSTTDALVRFAEVHRMAVHGHTLVWHIQTPKWLENGDFDRKESIEILGEHIGTVAGRYRGRILVWDVVNEAWDDQANLRDTIWLRRIGPDFMDLAFRFAKETDPRARLLYNDYGLENGGPKTDAVFAGLQGLLERGVPLDGIGFQVHCTLDDLDLEKFAAVLRRFAGLGLETWITEADIRLKDPPSEDDLQKQGRIYRQLLELCLREPSCRAFQTWGFTDRYSWVPGWFKGTGHALPFDANYRPKPAYEAMRALLAAT